MGTRGPGHLDSPGTRQRDDIGATQSWFVATHQFGQELPFACKKQELRRPRQSRDNSIYRRSQKELLSLGEKVRQAKSFLGAGRFQVGTEHSGEPSVRTGTGRRSSIGGIAILWFFGQKAEQQIDIVHGREELRRAVAAQERTGGSTTDTRINQFSALQSLWIGTALRNGLTVQERNEIACRRSDIEQQRGSMRREACGMAGEGQPVRRRSKERRAACLLQVHKMPCRQPDTKRNSPCDLDNGIKNGLNSLPLALKAIAQLAGHGEGQSIKRGFVARSA